MRPLLLLLFTWMGLTGLPVSGSTPAGDSTRLPLRLTVFDHATLLPGADEWGIWGLPVHPGFTAGTEFRYRRWAHASLFQSAVVGYD